MMRKKSEPQKVDAALKPEDGLTQSERFIKAAQELGTDDDPERFKERVRKLAQAPASKPPPHLSRNPKASDDSD